MQVKLGVAVKADAYGHGAHEVARTAMANGADLLCVAAIAEAAELRLCGKTQKSHTYACLIGIQCVISD